MIDTRELLANLKANVYRDRLREIYVDETILDHQTQRYIRLVENFVKLYGDTEVEIYSAPGRSEIGGNHTDHQHGQVLAASINLDIIAVAAKADDDLIQVKSDDYPPIIVNTRALQKEEKEEGTSKGIIRGMCAKFQESGFRLGGFKAVMTSEVLGGSGLSSSAAFEVVIGNILSGLYNDSTIDAVTIAIASQYAENVYFGKPCGLMDQMACSVGGMINIDFKEPSAPSIHQVDVDFESNQHCLCIVDTKGSHADLTPDYAAVPEEMISVAGYFGKKYLRDVSKDEVIQNLPTLRKEFGDRAVLRAFHFLDDHARVSTEVQALENNDFQGFLNAITESGNSSYKYLQNVYSPSHADAQGLSMGLYLSEQTLKSEGACRVHGGGFAGTIQAFVPNHLVESYRSALDACFGEGSCHVLHVRSFGGMKVL